MKTLICQIRTTAERLDGMSYIIRCADGSVIVVDGAMYDGDPELLLEQLCKITGSDHPVVDYWFITHNHMDHTFCFMACAEKYADKLTVKKMVYSFFPEEIYAVMEPACVPELHRFEAAVDIFGAGRVTPAAGDVMELGGTKIEFLYTAADCPIINGGKGMTVNDSSMVFRVTADGQTVLFLGDVEKLGDGVMIEKYGKSLKSDVCQVAHHGWNASTVEFYDIVDPDILLWPVDMRFYPTMLHVSRVDRHIAGEMNVKDIFVAGKGTVWLEMPIEPRKDPDLPEIPPIGEKTGGEEIVIPQASAAPALDPLDPLWSQGVPVELSNNVYEYSVQMYAEKDGAERSIGDDRISARLLWRGDSLYMRVSGKKATFSDHDHYRSADSDSLRLYVCEDVVMDPWTSWSEKADDPAWVDNVKFYYEPKNIGGEPRFTSCPERSDAAGICREDGFDICLRFDLVRPHGSGDLISLNFEFNGVRKKGQKRAYCLSYCSMEAPPCFSCPYALVTAKLG